jgi:DNA-binding Lrp family transcriptional regulator
MINVSTEGKLTKKQEQALRTIETIIRAFYNDKSEKQERTRNELKQVTKLSSGVLSKHIKELICQGVIKGTVKIIQNRQTICYEYTENFIEIKGKRPQSMIDTCRITFNHKGIVGYQWGYLKKGRGGAEYFIPRKEKE